MTREPPLRMSSHRFFPFCTALATLIAAATRALGDPPAGASGAPALVAPVSNNATVPNARDTDIASLSFDEAVRLATARNPSIVVAREETRRVRALLEEVRASSLPTVVGTGSYTRLDANRVANGVTFAAENQLNVNVVVAVPLVAPARWAQWSHAHDQVDVAIATEADARRGIAVSTARTYVSLVSQHRYIETAQHALATARDHLQFAQGRFNGGIGNRLDVVRASQDVQSDELNVVNQQLAARRLQEALGVLVGSQNPVDAVEDLPQRAPPSPSEAQHEAQDNRTDVRVGEVRVRAAEHATRDNYTDYLPTLLATFMPFYQDPPSVTFPHTGWQAQLILTVPFYDGGLRYGQAHERDAITAESRANLEGVLRQARSEVRTAFEAVRMSELAAQSAHDAMGLANEASQLAEMGYRAGAATSLDVIDAAQRSRDAETAAAVADDAVRSARLELLIAIGRFPQP